MVSARISLSMPGGVSRPLSVPVVADTVTEFAKRAALAIQAFARHHGIAPIAVEYTVKPSEGYTAPQTNRS